MADVKSFEHPTLKVNIVILYMLRIFKHYFSKVPYEFLNKKFRTAQKTLDREVSHVQQAASELEKIISENTDNIPTKDAIKLLGGMVLILFIK